MFAPMTKLQMSNFQSMVPNMYSLFQIVCAVVGRLNIWETIITKLLIKHQEIEDQYDLAIKLYVYKSLLI